jgi:tetratricopeptide (TPR) repeat protein
LGGLILAVVGAVPAVATTRPEPTDPIEQAYRTALAMDFQGAAGAFSRKLGGDGGSDEARLGLALSLLNEQPKSRSKLDRTRQLLESVESAHPTDELGAAALYFLARIAHTHETPTNPVAAEELYRRVFTRHPTSVYAERAFLFSSILRQYAPQSPAEKRATLAALDEEATHRLTGPVPLRLYHLAAGLAWSQLLQDDRQALAHGLRVHALGLEGDYEYSNLLVRLGELSRRSGDRAAALKFYREFLARYPADRRTGLVTEWVQYLEKPVP